MEKRNFTKGLHDLGNGAYAYLQPDGGWGWSNAGLIVDGDESLLVDTLFDTELTAEMLKCIQGATGKSAEDIGVVVNTHANGDHCHGNHLCTKAEIVSSVASAKEMEEFPPSMMAQMMQYAEQHDDLREYLGNMIAPFNFEGLEIKMPTKTFEDELNMKVGDKDVYLKNVGPAHTKGDVLAYVPDNKAIYTGDILFINSTPLINSGPVGNWIEACHYIESLDVENIVPGHGPITDKNGVKAVREYLAYIEKEARKRYDSGLSIRDAAFDISLGDYESWGDNERIAANVNALYAEFGATEGVLDPMGLLGLMAEIAKDRSR